MDPDDASASQSPADDLQEIKGIGRGIAQRLRDAGVRTFAELAGHGPAEIAAKARVQASRVTRERWIAQARALAERSTDGDGDGPGTADDAERRESFVLRLTLDEDGRIGRTSVTHVRTGGEAPPWAGWDTARLLGFLSEYVDLSPQERQPPAPERQQPPPPEDQGRVAPAIVTPGEIRVRDLEVLPAAAGSSQRSLEAGEPFVVRMRLDPVGAGTSAGTQLSYSVTVVARTVGEPRRQTRTVGETAGTLAAGGDLELRSSGLPPGIYRLDGAVRVRVLGTDLPRRLVTVQGGLLQVTQGGEGSSHGPERSAG